MTAEEAIAAFGGSSERKPIEPTRFNDGDFVAWSERYRRLEPYTLQRFTPIPKLLNEVRSASTTLLNDGELVFVVPSTGKYIIRLVAFINTANAAMDYKYATNFTGTATSVTSFRRHVEAGLSAAPGTENVLAGTAQISSTAVTHSTAFGVGRVEIEIVMDVTVVGTWSFQWAQNTSDLGSITCLAGSLLEWMKLS